MPREAAPALLYCQLLAPTDCLLCLPAHPRCASQGNMPLILVLAAMDTTAIFHEKAQVLLRVRLFLGRGPEGCCQ